MLYFNIDIVGRKKFPTHTIFHHLEKKEVRSCQFWTALGMWYNSPANTNNVLHGLQTVMGPDAITWQGKGCFFFFFFFFFFSGLTLKLQSFSLVGIAKYLSGLLVCVGSRKLSLFPSPKTVNICILSLFYDGEFKFHHSMVCSFDCGSQW